jgi:hypothetical protein
VVHVSNATRVPFQVLATPVITDFTDGDGNDRMKETVQANYRRIKEEVKQIVQEELERIANDENLKHLLQQK